ncbi:LamG domain-containing protein, partial [Candidatus Woesearchaeota archaeon]|nr:LamG domain-containing protein [Candidatus Woesearchaeota archaeon]
MGFEIKELYQNKKILTVIVIVAIAIFAVALSERDSGSSEVLIQGGGTTGVLVPVTNDLTPEAKTPLTTYKEEIFVTGNFPTYSGNVIEYEEPFVIKEYEIRVLSDDEVFVKYTIGLDKESKVDLDSFSDVVTCIKADYKDFTEADTDADLKESFVEKDGEICSVLSLDNVEDKYFSGVLTLDGLDDFEIKFGTGSTVVHFTASEGELQSDAVNDVFVYDTANDNIEGLWKAGGTVGKCAMNFDGSGDYVTIPKFVPTRITVGAWVYLNGNVPNIYPAVAQVYGSEASDWGGWRMAFLRGTNRPMFTVNTGPSTSTGVVADNPISINEWHYLTGTFNGASLTLYIDGIPVKNTTLSGNIRTPTTSYNYIGYGRSWSGDIYAGYLNAKLDEIQVYDRALSQQEIQTNYNRNMQNLKSNIATNLIAHWGFDECSGSTAGDESGNARTGTVTAATWKPKSSWFTEGSNDEFGAYFDGSGDYFTVTDSDDFDFGSNNFTISFWANIDTWPASGYYGGLIGKQYSGYGPFDIMTHGDGLIRFLGSTDGSSWAYSMNAYPGLDK